MHYTFLILPINFGKQLARARARARVCVCVCVCVSFYIILK